MKPKRDAVVTGTRGAGASGSASGGGAKPRGRPSKQGAKKVHTPSTAGKKAAKTSNLTAVRVAHIISQLDNKRGSTMESIRSKLVRTGHQTNTSLVRNALERAVKSGLLREIKEERFSLPTQRSGNNSNSSSSSSSSSRTRNKNVMRVASVGQRGKLHLSPSGLRSKRRQRRPPRGRRPAAGSDASADEDGRDLRDDDDTGLGDGDVEDQCNDTVVKNTASSRVSVAEPVAGCDAVMVFGTH